MSSIIWAMIWFLALGGVFGLILAYAGKIFSVEVDERVEAIKEILPGANCGGCGNMGCEAFAQAIVNGTAKNGDCPVGGEKTVEKIAEIMGQNVDEIVRYRAQVMCTGVTDKARHKYDYMGISNCIAASRLAGGSKACPNGCLGFGTCVEKCKFDAINIVNGVAAVDYNKCKACGACVAACPKKIIKLIPYDSAHWVGCISNDKGAVTRKYCDVGCIACKICEKKCKQQAIKVNDFIASIEYDKCTNCGECLKSCPRNVIWSNVMQEEFIAANQNEQEHIVEEQKNNNDVK